jgi:hypothetical protein
VHVEHDVDGEFDGYERPGGEADVEEDDPGSAGRLPRWALAAPGATAERTFYSLGMTGPDSDRLRYAQIAGTAARHALGWRLTAEEEAAAVAELAESAAGRADLLAQCAGLALGFGEGAQDAARYGQMAGLCIAAGADEALIERWVTVGRERAASAAAVPYSGRRAGELTGPRWSSSPRGFRRPWRVAGHLGFLTE